MLCAMPTLWPATGIIPILTETLWRDSFPLCMTVICNLNNLQKGIWWSEVRPNWAVLGSYNDALVGGEEEGEGYTNICNLSLGTSLFHLVRRKQCPSPYTGVLLLFWALSSFLLFSFCSTSWCSSLFHRLMLALFDVSRQNKVYLPNGISRVCSSHCARFFW